ncbi:MAG: protein kinase [Phycisphaerales bacterium]|nr:MAG: protein kinase [Phycisphaerales bacterium]
MSVDRTQPSSNSENDSPRRSHDAPKGTEGASPSPPLPSTETLRDAPSRLPKEIGRYHVKRVIASGGMGTVYEAVQEHPRRTVAVKVMKRGIASRSAMRRFEYESQILARLQHPGIAQVYEAGTHTPSPFEGEGWGEGAVESVPFFAMEYIPNAKPITKYAQEKKLGTRERLDLFGRVCDAVHHGHQKGIIHRDLKPSNILIDSHGQPRIIDFGVARATDSDLAVTTLQTDVGQLIGTMQYMSPEQCEADPHDLDIRSDVYALGVVLYELLCRRLPYDVGKIPVYEATRMVREHQPTRLSTIDRALRGDVETIVFKALEKDREQRYRSAADLADDINRYLTGEAIFARPPSIIYQLRVFARRNKTVFGAITTVFLVLAAASVISSYLYLKAEKEKQAAQHQTYVANMNTAQMHLTEGGYSEARRWLEACPVAFRGWEWNHLDLALDQSLLTVRAPTGKFATFSTDGMFLVAGRLHSPPGVWDAETGAFCFNLETPERAEDGMFVCEDVAFSPDGKRIAAAFEDGSIGLWDYKTGKHLYTLQGPMGRGTGVTYAQTHVVSFSADGKRLFSGPVDGSIRVWDAGTGRAQTTLLEHADLSSPVVFGSSGERIITGSEDDTLSIWSLESGDLLSKLRGHEGGVRCAAFSPNGQRIASGANDTTLRLWDAETGDLLSTLHGHEDSVRCVAFSPDGDRVASGSTDQTIRVWDAQTGRIFSLLRGHDGSVASVAFSPDGQRIVSVSLGELRVWDVMTGGAKSRLSGPRGAVNTVALNLEGDRVVAGTEDGSLWVWDAETGKTLHTLQGHEGAVTAAVFSPNGHEIASGSEDRTLRAWDARTGEPLATLRGHEADLQDVAFTLGGERIVSISSDKSVWLWDAESFRQHTSFSARASVTVRPRLDPDSMLGSFSEDNPASLVISPNATRFYCGPGEGAHTWAAKIDNVTSLIGPGGLPRQPDGTLLITSHYVCDTQTGNLLAFLNDGTSWVSAAFSRDAGRIVVGGANGSMSVWDVETSARICELQEKGNAIRSLAFTPDATRVVSGSDDGALRIWDAATGHLLATLRGHDAPVRCVAFSRDGERIVSGSADGCVRMWESRLASARRMWHALKDASSLR